MTAASDDPLPAYMFASWLSFLIPASYACVHGPDVVADAIQKAAYLLGKPLLFEATPLIVAKKLSSVLLVAISAVLFSGYLLYSFAPLANGSHVVTYVGAFVACTFCALIFPFSAWVWGGVWETRMATGVFTWLAWLLYLRQSTGSDRALRRPFVLFFRRFDSFADLSILPSLLRLTPSNVPVVMLVSGAENEIGYWDPIKLMTYGIRANTPWGGKPVFLKGGERWEVVMESLVKRSGVVVLDNTEKSEAMDKEIKTVAEAGRPLILLSETNEQTHGDSIDGKNDVEIAYRRDRSAFIVRAGMVASIVAITAYLVELPRQLREKAAQGDLWSGLFGAAIMLGFVAAISGGLLLRLGLSRSTRHTLATALRVRLALPS